MRRKNVEINLDKLIVVVAELIPGPPPKTIGGKIRHWLLKLIKIKNTLGIKIK